MAAASYQVRPDLASRLEETAVEHIATLVALPGQRGAGKTQLAAALARSRMADGWRVVAWINAETESGFHAGVEELAEELGVRREGESFAGTARRVRRHLEDNGEHCLLVFDNAVDPRTLRPALPRAGLAQIVITTTQRSFARLSNATVVDVGGFTPAEAKTYLSARTSLNDSAGAGELARELGYLPLGLAQASWVIVSQGLSYQGYLEKLRNRPIDEVMQRDTADEYQLTVVQAIALSMDDLDRRHQTAARRLIELISLLSPDGVPRHYLSDAPRAGFGRTIEVSTADGDPVQFPMLESPAAVDQALGTLAETSLLLFSGDRSRVIVHRLVARVVRYLSRPWRHELADRARRLLGKPGESLEVSERAWRHWIDPTDMLPDEIMSGQWASLVRALKEGGLQVEWTRVNDLVSQYQALISNVDDEHWSWRQSAEAWVRQFGLESAIERASERVRELARTAGRNELATAYARVHLGYAYWASGQRHSAAREFKRAVPVFRRVHGPWHVRTRMLRESLAVVRSEPDTEDRGQGRAYRLRRLLGMLQRPTT